MTDISTQSLLSAIAIVISVGALIGVSVTYNNAGLNESDVRDILRDSLPTYEQYDDTDLRNEITALETFDEILSDDLDSVEQTLIDQKSAILSNTQDIIRNHPTGPTPPPSPNTPRAGTLSLEIDKTQYKHNELVELTGEGAIADERVLLEIVDSEGRKFQVATNSDKRGDFTFLVAILPNDPIGWYDVFAEQGDRKSKSLSFRVID